MLLNDAPVTVNSWTATSIIITIPSGATSGSLVVSVAPTMNDSNPVKFTVTSQPLPLSWLDQDIGKVGVAGSATYSGGVITVQGSGSIGSTSDTMHFVYEPLSGNGSIVARVVSVSGGSYPEVGVMIRQTLNANDINAFAYYWQSQGNFTWRSSAGGNTNSYGTTLTSNLPLWIELVRSGNTVSAFMSSDGLNWRQATGWTETVTMGTNIYIGLAVGSGSSSTLATATFDNVSVSSTASPAPIITGVSATTGAVGAQVTISGSGFGSTQGSSVVLLNDAPMTVNSWAATSIIITIPSGATSGSLVVSVAPSMNDSNPVKFTVTSQPLPTPWLDQDVGLVGAAGSASFSGGVFTVQGNGWVGSTADTMHFVYQPLSGDGSIVARVVSVSGGSSPEVGVMIRQTLNTGDLNAFECYGQSTANFTWRPTASGNTDSDGTLTASLPVWLMVVRTGNTLYGYKSSDGVNWVQGTGWTETVTMGTDVYVGLAVGSGSSSTLATATFDNGFVTIGTTPFVTGLSPVLGGIGASVTITGSNFGATQGTSTVTFNGTAASSITSWSNSQIVATVPSGATTGQVSVTVNSIQSPGNPTFTVINPVVTSIVPSQSPVQGLVTINGAGFGTYPQQVLFNGAEGGPVTWTDTAITIHVPPTATTGPVTVLENGVSSNGVNFTVEQLSITGIAPSSGQAGSSVTISGTGFGSAPGASTVTFDGVTATTTSWNDTAIVATVPVGASTGPVTVQVTGVTADGPSFEVTSTVTLSDSLGHQTSYASVMVGGKWYVSTAQGSGCSSCTIRGSILKYQYDNFGNVQSTTDELGRTTSYTYDSHNNVTSRGERNLSVSGGAPTTSYTYNSFGEALTMTDPLGNVTTNTYDSNGNLISVTSPAPGGARRLALLILHTTHSVN